MMIFYTATGNKIDYENIERSNISIIDVAISLSLLNRFCGHTFSPYSVAQHSIMVSKVAENMECLNNYELALYGLLHDSAEAYIGDIITPIKNCANRKIEHRFLKLILNKFGLKYPVPEIIREIDNRMLVTETKFFANVKNLTDGNISTLGNPYNIKIECLPIKRARSLFIQRFEFLSSMVL